MIRACILCLSLALSLADAASAQQEFDFDSHLKVALEKVPADRVTITTEDGVEIAAFHAAPKNAEGRRPAVIMLHGGNQRKEFFWAFGIAEALADDGYHLLSIDIRGRGESASGNDEDLKQNPALALKDIDAALAWLRTRDDVDPDRIALIGASYGANLTSAWLMLNDDKGVRTSVTLSATRMAVQFPHLAGGKEGPIACSGLYLGASEEPPHYRVSEIAEQLEKLTQGRAVSKIYEGKTHAFGVLVLFPESLELIDNWLAKELAAKP